MSKKSLSRIGETLPSVFDDFFKPWNEWFNGNGLMQHTLTVPAVNVTDEDDAYNVTLAVPGSCSSSSSVRNSTNKWLIF